MFYIKSQKPSGKTIRTEITDENVFTRCPECGRELPIDLADIFSDGEGDLFSTGILCSACALKRSEQRKCTDGLKLTVDGLALLGGMWCEAGYGEDFFCLLDKFEVESIRELEPDQYEPFLEALMEIAGDTYEM